MAMISLNPSGSHERPSRYERVVSFAPVDPQETRQRGERPAVGRVRREQPRYLGTEPAVNAGEPLPRLVPLMTFFYRQRGSLAAEVVPSHLRQPL